MISLDCAHARRLLERRESGLSEAERLRLEAHVAGCSACAAQGRGLSGLVALAQSMEPALSASQRQRAIEQALSVSAPRVVPIGGARASVSYRWALASAAALLLVVGTWRLWPVLRVTPDVATVTTPVTGVQRFEAAQARRVHVEGAELWLSAGTSITWDAHAARVDLVRGKVRAQVQSRRGKPAFSVHTERLNVVVVGTDFEVTRETVRVYEGVVRVEDGSGQLLHPALRAGEQWPQSIAQAGAATVNASTPGETPVVAQAQPAARRSDGAQSTREGRSGQQWLSDARARLASGDVAGARASVGQARRGGLELAQRAEAETLLAEALQMEGKQGAAIAQYERVAKSFSATAAGDNARFAAARLTLARGDRQAALQRFERYLHDYPQGRFVAEAKRSLSQLTQRTSDASPR